ncbi:pseudouridine-metabolizing bifunctional protein C1861.05-like isoform X1 [Rana temporaria]|uniref:pseudouridine-metabolizing bifunctional protein C1861.05-like isoform X1 n=1 Tax=Rana temporaria TaxID=8407 RepID=UPI001AAD9BE6|nr:pseudouridine-metabolizing bifunctional protein C1861.05-like isoform X1 [Rana temporaria]XP_040201667.1 pseudouridine-metabolizing bifunctional protein C1861.05-like isoform X1 [Rana temporaria]XP_040201668.1 pseudouridine-metabolizing bifunctional protein C1861.05-like isoform X1 [Rana temporaria]XP_040201669.1 pseudouridine-metabolizing bifunctional protein C1861.05-like isoform X1 [Rana temporaria]
MLVSALRRCSAGVSGAVVRAGVPVTPGQVHRHSSTFRIHSSVEEALAEGRPVVALESTIITHGMPYPQNIRMANEVEEIVRSNGSVPATVGIIDGKVHIGLHEEELKFLATTKGCVKVSRRDLPFVLSQGLSGGSTVSGTMIAAHHAGISVFVTGGIGGVHRDGENTMDVSADLTELGRTPVAVISAGVKSILDIGRTLEYLETEGVCVSTFGDSRDFPAFFTPRSGCQAPYNVRNEEEAAKLIAHSLELRVGSGVLIAVPIPPEHAASGEIIEEAIQQALEETRLQGIRGKDVTPFVLQRVNELTGGRSLESNIALVKNNAKVGSRIAAALCQIRKPKGGTRKGPHQRERQEDDANQDSRPVVIGGIIVDFIAKATQDKMEFGGQTNPGQVHQSCGGVGRNLADCLSRLGVRPLFISALGQDELSCSALQYCSHMDMRGVARLKGQSTATYCAVINGSGELSLGVGDMEIHQQITEKHVSQFADSLRQSCLVCLDGNVPVSTIQYVCEIARQNRVPVCYEPTDVAKAAKPFTSDSWTALTYISPNLKELISINRTLGHSVNFDIPCAFDDVIDMAITLSLPLLENLHCVIVTLGAHGVLLCGHSCNGVLSLHPNNKTSWGDLCALHYPAAPISAEEIVNVSGAGDSLMAGFLSGVLGKLDTDTCVRMGLLAARLSLRSRGAISQLISPTSISVQQVAEETWPAPTVWTIPPTNGKSFLRTRH